MRLSILALILIPVTYAAPVPAPGLLDSLGGLRNAVNESIERPGLLLGRIEVVVGLTQTKSALQSIIDETADGNNKDVRTNAKTALESINKVQSAVDSIGEDIFEGATPKLSDQTAVAQGIAAALEPFDKLKSAVVKPSNKLTKGIKKAQKALALLVKGGGDVLVASGLTPEDVGLGPSPAKNGKASSSADAPSSTTGASSTNSAKAPKKTAAPADEVNNARSSTPERAPDLELIRLDN